MKNDYSHKLSPLQRQVLVGTLLGDAHLRANSKKTKYQYVVLQSGYHKEYVFHLYEIFKNCTTKPPKEYTFKDKRYPGKTYTRWSFYTTFQGCFRFYAHQFYNDLLYDSPSLSPLVKQKNASYKKCKKVPKLIHKYLTPLSIAYWYMDSGAQKWKGKKRGVRFCTDNFTLSEVDRLSKVLREKYLLKISIQKQASFFRIYVSSSSYLLLKSLIYALLIPSIVYKFPIEEESKD